MECRSYIKHLSNWTEVRDKHWFSTETLGPPTLSQPLLRAVWGVGAWGDTAPRPRLLWKWSVLDGDEQA